MYDKYFETEFFGSFVRTNVETGRMEMSKNGGPWTEIEPIEPDSIGAWTPLTEDECLDLIKGLKK